MRLRAAPLAVSHQEPSKDENRGNTYQPCETIFHRNPFDRVPSALIFATRSDRGGFVSGASARYFRHIALLRHLSIRVIASIGCAPHSSLPMAVRHS